MSAWSRAHKRKIGPRGRRGSCSSRVGGIGSDAVGWVLVEVELDLVGRGNQGAEVRIAVSRSDLDTQFLGDVAKFVVVRVEPQSIQLVVGRLRGSSWIWSHARKL